MAHVIIGTAGHIDHGKSSLVRVLTGMDPDRLKEEKERGMTIDLGFAFYGETAAFIDVPGHERFVKNMVAGVSTIDFVLLVIAADDGIMPQTREHLDILTLLGLKRGIIALNKIDLAEPDWLELVEEEIRTLTQGTFLKNAPLVPVSAQTGAGIDALKKTLDRFIRETQPRADRGFFWLPIDRVFTMKGFGTVVTGSVLSGSAAIGDQLSLMPQNLPVRVRGLQAHGQSVERVQIGARAALNLVGLEKTEAQRGDLLTTPDQFQPTDRLNVRLRLLPNAPRPLKNRTRVRCHIGTRELMGRVILLDTDSLAPGELAYAQLALEDRTVANRLDAFVIRSYSPLLTIGGGLVLDTRPEKSKRHDPALLEQLKSLEQENPEEVVLARMVAAGYQPMSTRELATTAGLQEAFIESLLPQLKTKNRIVQLGSDKRPLFIHASVWQRLKSEFQRLLAEYHQAEPWRPGLSKGDLVNRVKPAPDRRLAEHVLAEMMAQNSIREANGYCKLADHRITLSASEEAARQKLLSILQTEGFTTSSAEELSQRTAIPLAQTHKVLGAMLGLGDVILNDDIYFTTARVEAAKEIIRKFFVEHEEMSISECRQLLDTSRKYAFALINYFDTIGFTERSGDGRRLK